MALKSTGDCHAPLLGMLCVGSTSCQPKPLKAGFSLRNRVFIVSMAAQPVQSDGEIMTAFTPAWLRIRSSSGWKPSTHHVELAGATGLLHRGSDRQQRGCGERALHDVGLGVLEDGRGGALL